jgi:hypothetical protein
MAVLAEPIDWCNALVAIAPETNLFDGIVSASAL